MHFKNAIKKMHFFSKGYLRYINDFQLVCIQVLKVSYHFLINHFKIEQIKMRNYFSNRRKFVLL